MTDDKVTLSPVTCPPLHLVLRVAIVHDYFCNLGGSDAVARALHELFPEAPVYTLLIYDRNRAAELVRGMDLHTSFLQRLPFAGRTHQPFLPLMPLAIESLDLRGYDLVLSSSHTVAKGVIPPPDALHICYCHTPMRYAWDLETEYLATLPALVRPFVAIMFHRLRQWDVTSAARVDFFIANSNFVARRIWKYYRRTATVIPPPVDTDFYAPLPVPREDFYLMAGRLAVYKRADLAVQAFARLRKPLVVIGDGPARTRLQKIAAPNITFLGGVPRETLREYFCRCRALIFPGVEDFGLVPLEAMACGAPVIAYGVGGVRDTVRDGEMGVLFTPQTVEALMEAVARFERLTFDPRALRAHALDFAPSRFAQRMQEFIRERYDEFHRPRP